MDISDILNKEAVVLEFQLEKVEIGPTGHLAQAAKDKVAGKVAQLKAAPTCKNVYYGQQIEDPAVVVFCSEHTSVPADFSPFGESGPWGTNHWLVKTTHETENVLNAPVMEMCTAFDCLPQYIDAVKRFVGHIDNDKPRGYHASCYGETLTPLSPSQGTAPGKAANLLLGWDSKEAHTEAKAKPGNPILANIQLLREGRGSLAMFHVAFTKA